jgi:hypothetical protein
VTEISPELQEMLEDLHALCEKGLRCHFLSNAAAMCITCQAAHTIYQQHTHINRLERTPS